MDVAILYTTSHGTTKRVAHMISDVLGASARVVLIDLKKEKDPSLDGYDTVILGTSVHMGKPANAMLRYVTETKHKDVLEGKSIGLFVCCMEPDEKKCRRQFEHAFPEYLHDRAKASVVAGGEFVVERMNRLEKLLVSKMMGCRESVDRIDRDAIRQFTEEMKK